MNFDIEGIRVTNSSGRLQEFLSNLPDGKLLTVNKVAGRLRLNPRTIRYQIIQLPKEYYYKSNTLYLLGNPQTVKQYAEYCERELS